MLHWLIIILGVFSLSMSISNPVYNLIFRKYIKVNFFVKIILRFLLFLIGIFFVLLGLYFESNY